MTDREARTRAKAKADPSLRSGWQAKATTTKATADSLRE
jgi:hypothetical protein